MRDYPLTTYPHDEDPRVVRAMKKVKIKKADDKPFVFRSIPRALIGGKKK